MTAILTQRCDPFGVERERYGQKLAGGLYTEASVGKYVWHCEEPVTGRYRMICQGGDYGFRRANDQGIVAAYHCDGGHKGQVMALCRKHVREFSQHTYAKPKPLDTPAYDGSGHEQFWAPGSQVGGSRAADMCPACVAPPQARVLMERADFLQAQLSAMVIHGIMSRIPAIESELDQVRAGLDELHERGVIHKCPLRLEEVH